MSAGTLTVVNGSDVVEGLGTDFLSELSPGDFFVVKINGSGFTVGVKSITSAGQLIAARAFSGPSFEGAPWTAIPRDTEMSIPVEVSENVTYLLRVYVNDSNNWLQLLTVNDNVTVTAPDGSQYTGPSWLKLTGLLADLDLAALQAMADEINLAAQQVALDKIAAEEAAAAAVAARNTAVSAAQDSSDAAQSSNQSKLDAAEDAQRAEDARDRAEAAAEEVDGSAYLRKDDNLASLTDKAAARSELDVYDRAEVDEAIQNGGSGIPLGFQYHHSNRAKLNAGTVVGDGQIVTIAGSFSDLADHAEANEPLTTEALWQSDPSKRGCYVIDRTAGTMRLPDLNGVQPGSHGPVYKTGDGGTIAAGTITQNAAPDAAGDLGGFYGEPTYVDLRSTGVFDLSTGSADKTKSGIGTAWTGLGANFALSRGHAAYGRNGTTRVKPDSQHGVWVIQYANAAQNSGEIDALGIDTDLQQFKSTQLAKNAQIEGRIGYALVTTTTNIALSGRMVLTNPFGINTPVICLCEIYHATLAQWVTTDWIWGGNNLTHGITANYKGGEGIILRAAQASFVAGSQASGSSGDFSTNYATPSPVRVHVWKVTS